VKDFEQHAGQIGGFEQGAAAATPGAPNVIIVPETRRHLSLRTIAGVGMACLAIGGGYAAVEEFFHLGSGIVGDIGHFLANGAPHTEVTETQAMNDLEHISLPDETIVVQGTGTGTSNISMEKKSSGIPLVSSVWNGVFAQFTEMTAGVSVAGAAQVVAPPATVSYSPYRVANAKSDSNPWGIQVTVDTNQLFLQDADMVYVLNSKGKPEVPSHDGVFIRFGTAVTGNSSDSQRTADVTTISEDSFLNTCGSTLTSYLSTGLEKDLKNGFGQFKPLLSTIPGAAQAVGEMLQEPIHVVFEHSTTAANGTVTTSYINPSQITFPHKSLPTQQAIAKDFDVTASSVQIDGTGKQCWYSGSAIKDQNRILELSHSSSVSTEQKVQ
jgi:hypothetical protein